MANKIYQPPGAPFDFLALDGVENALMRSDTGGSTVGTGVDLLVTVLVVPNAFDQNGKHLSARFFGNFNNAAGGTKRILINFDAIPLFDVNVGALANSNFELNLFGIRRVNTFLQTRVWLEHQVFTGGGVAVTKLARSDVLGSVDFSIPHTFTVFGEVSNAADTVVVDCFVATML